MKRNLLHIAAFVLAFQIQTIAQTTDPAPYCSAQFDDVDDTFDVPDQVKSMSFGTLENITNAQCAYPHYVLYNNLTAPNLSIGSSYPLSITFEVHGGSGYGVWIDYNHNSVFEPTEKVAGSTFDSFLEISDNTVVTGDITISPIAMAGQTRMRVRIVEDDMYTAVNGAAISACNASASAEDIMDWGETEDYIVNIISTVGISPVEVSSSISVYPNPTQNTLFVQSAKQYSYQIYNTTGAFIQQVNNTGGNSISIAELPNGLYFIRLIENNQIITTKRFVKAAN